MSTADLGALIPELQPFAKALVDLGGRAGVQPRVTSTLRLHSLQKRLYAAYLRGESKYPVAPPGTSAHEFGYAFDMIAATVEDLHDLGTVWRQWGGLWSPNDEVHFEYPGFVAPRGGVITEAAEVLNQLPWYESIFLPTALGVEQVTPSEQEKYAHPLNYLCKTYGWFC